MHHGRWGTFLYKVYICLVYLVALHINSVLVLCVYSQDIPVWPCPGVSLDGATLSPDPSCLSRQYLCCSSLCVGGLGSVCYIWSTSPVLFGVLCESKCAFSNSLLLSFFLSLGGPEP